jgi:hypothetical protein
VLKDTLYVWHKHLATLVIVAALATIVTAAGIPKAAEKAIGDSHACRASDLKNAMVPLELGKGKDFLLGKSPRAECLLAGLGAMLDADNFFLVSYSLLNLFLFLFLAGAVRLLWSPLWCFTGVALSATMLVGDWLENRALYLWITQASRAAGRGAAAFPMPPPWFLGPATTGKWMALAVSSLLVGLYYLYAIDRPSLLKLLTLPAAFGAGALLTGVCRNSPEWILTGMYGLVLLWAGGLLQAILAVTERPAAGLPGVEVSPRG